MKYTSTFNNMLVTISLLILPFALSFRMTQHETKVKPFNVLMSGTEVEKKHLNPIKKITGTVRGYLLLYYKQSS